MERRSALEYNLRKQNMGFEHLYRLLFAESTYAEDMFIIKGFGRARISDREKWVKIYVYRPKDPRRYAICKRALIFSAPFAGRFSVGASFVRTTNDGEDLE